MQSQLPTGSKLCNYATSGQRRGKHLIDSWCVISLRHRSQERWLTFPQALKAFVLVNQPDAPLKQRGISEINRLCIRSPAVTDIAALYQIQDAFKQLSLNTDEGSKIWDRAAASMPNDKDLLMTWVSRSVSESDWLGAQKV